MEPPSNSGPRRTLGLRTRELCSEQHYILILSSHPPSSPEIARPTEPRPGSSESFLLCHATGINNQDAFSRRPPTRGEAFGGSCDPARRDTASPADSSSRCSVCSRAHHRNKQTARQAPPPRPPALAKPQPLRVHLRLLTSSFPETLLPLFFLLLQPLPLSSSRINRTVHAKNIRDGAYASNATRGAYPSSPPSPRYQL